MKKTIVIVGIVCLISGLFICGCTQQDNSGANGNDGGTAGKTLTMTVKEFYDDMVPPGGMLSLTILYSSLEDGDTLILQDTIPEITYDSNTQSTNVRFEWSEEQNGGTLTSSRTFRIEGNITDEFQIGNEFKLTVKIKHVTFSNPLGEGEIELELFEEEWVNEEYFVENLATSGLKPLPQSCIEKV